MPATAEKAALGGLLSRCGKKQAGIAGVRRGGPAPRRDVPRRIDTEAVEKRRPLCESGTPLFQTGPHKIFTLISWEREQGVRAGKL